MGNPIPTQIRSIDSFASYNSNIANRLTRIITDGLDCLLQPSPIEVEEIDSTSVIVTSGKCVKDDVLIEIQSLNIDLDDSDFFIDSTAWVEVGYYYVVMQYTYAKIKPPPVASIKIIHPSLRATHYTSDVLFLACLDISAPGGIHRVDQILDYDPENPNNKRNVMGGAGLVSFINVDVDYIANSGDNTIKVTGNSNITLPPSLNSSQELRIIKVDSAPNIVTVTAHLGDLIEDVTSIELLEQWNEITLIPDRITTWVEV
jgi:hypothetical protein